MKRQIITSLALVACMAAGAQTKMTLDLTGKNATFSLDNVSKITFSEEGMLNVFDKLGASQLELSTAEFAGSGVPVRGSKAAEATAALVGLGYSQTEAAAALKGIDIETLSIEDVIRRALRAAAQQ